MLLESFVLIGTILSYDDVLSTVEFNLNPAVNGGASIAVIQNSAIPCEVKIGTKIYVVKDKSTKYPTITCEANSENR